MDKPMIPFWSGHTLNLTVEGMKLTRNRLFGTLFQAFGGVRHQANTAGNAGIFAEFQRMMDPANVNAVDAHGDYVFGQTALDRVISRLMEQHENGNAPGPASEAAIQALPNKKVVKDMLDDNGKAECSICMDAVEVGEPITILPCKHWFHESCIKAWLVEHDTCPHCRKGITPEPGAHGKASGGGGSGPPSRPPESSSPEGMPGRRQGNSGTARNPMVLDESPGPQDLRAARERYYSRQTPEDLERRQTYGRRSSRPTPSSSNDRRRRSSSYRSNSNGGSNNDSGGGFGGWVRSLGGGSGGER
jgi:E3 ubiquitin-protein ligase RNF115/126